MYHKIYIGNRHVVEPDAKGRTFGRDKKTAVYYRAKNARNYAQIDITEVYDRRIIKKRFNNNDYHIVGLLQQNTGLPDQKLIKEIEYDDVPKCCHPVFDLLEDYWNDR